MKRTLLLSLCTLLCFISNAQNTVNVNWKDSVKAIVKTHNTDTNKSGIFIAPIMVQQQSNDKCCGIKRPINKPNNGKTGNSYEFNLSLEWLKQYKIDLEASINTKSKEFDEKVDKQKQIMDVYDKYLTMRENLIDRWLEVFGVIISIFGVAIPIAGFLLGRKLVGDVNKQQKELDKEVEKMKEAVTTKMLNTDNEIWHIKNEINEKIAEANSYIIKLREYDKEGEEILSTTKSEANRRLATLSELALKSDLTDKEKNDAIKEARLITKEKDATPYEKEVASAHENYFSGNFETALDKYMNILIKFSKQIKTDELADFYFGIAHCAQETNDNYLAISYYLKVINQQPYQRNAVAYNNLGNAYTQILDYYNADINYKKSIEIDPFSIHTYNNYGNMLSEIHDYPNAINMLQKAIELDPTYENAYYDLVEIYLFINKIKDAKDTIEKITNKQDGKYALVKYLIDLFEDNNIDIELIIQNTSEAIKRDNINWSFRAFYNWLKSNHSDFVDKDKKVNINQFIDRLCRTLPNIRK